MNAVAATGASSGTEAIPFRRDDVQASGGASFLGAAVVLVGLGAWAFWALRRKQGKPASGRLPWLSKADVTQSPLSTGRTVLSPQVVLHVIEWRGEELLLGCTSQSVNVLVRRPATQSDPANGNAQ
jgi:hypothetical protein